LTGSVSIAETRAHILRQFHEDIVIHGGLCCDPGAAKLGLGLGEPHFRILDPKIRELNGNVGNGCGNCSLGSQSGDDCGIDLRLKSRCGGGLSFSYPSNKKKRDVGLELELAAAAAAATTTENKANEEAMSYRAWC
jgi:hypothetical protein